MPNPVYFRYLCEATSFATMKVAAYGCEPDNTEGLVMAILEEATQPRFQITTIIHFRTIDGWDSQTGDTELYAETQDEVDQLLADEKNQLCEGWHYEIYDRQNMRPYRVVTVNGTWTHDGCIYSKE